MAPETSYRVFISYTGRDLEAHAEVVSDMVKRLNNSDTRRSWVAIDHKFWAPTGRPSVQECREQIARCHILIVLVAFRYGWVPSLEEGGDGESSITRIEVEHARALGLEVIPFLAEDDARWNVADIEGRGDSRSKAQERLDRFKAELRKSLAGFFDSPNSLEASTVLALPGAAERIEQSVRRPTATVNHQNRSHEAEEIIPSYYDPRRTPTLKERLETKLPKRTLSLGSCGARTAIILGYLERLEQLLRIRYGDENFRICDYFDLIGASGFAATIAADLALGHTVAEARDTFINCASSMYSHSKLLRQIKLPLMFVSVFPSHSLKQTLEDNFGKISLSSEAFRTGICLVLSRMDKHKIHTVTNYPEHFIQR